MLRIQYAETNSSLIGPGYIMDPSWDEKSQHKYVKILNQVAD